MNSVEQCKTHWSKKKPGAWIQNAKKKKKEPDADAWIQNANQMIPINK